MCMYVAEITDVVDEFVKADKMFTAWDVTVALRKKSKSHIQHYEVKREVHQMFDNGSMFSYNRVLANLPGINPQPWIYHPVSADPSTYNGKPVSSAPAIAALPAPTSSMSSVDDDDDGSDIAADGSVVYKFDTTDRLCVPNKLIREIGLKQGDEVEVLCTVPPTSEVCVVPKNSGATFPGVPPHVSSQVATYVVDRYDNVRISRAVLTKIGISGVAFEMERDGTNGIKVKKYA